MVGVGSVNGFGERLNKQGSRKAMMKGGMQPRAEIAMQSQRPDYIPTATGYDTVKGWFGFGVTLIPGAQAIIALFHHHHPWMPMMNALWIPAEIMLVGPPPLAAISRAAARPAPSLSSAAAIPPSDIKSTIRATLRGQPESLVNWWPHLSRIQACQASLCLCAPCRGSLTKQRVSGLEMGGHHGRNYAAVTESRGPPLAGPATNTDEQACGCRLSYWMDAIICIALQAPSLP